MSLWPKLAAEHKGTAARAARLELTSSKRAQQSAPPVFTKRQTDRTFLMMNVQTAGPWPRWGFMQWLAGR